MDILKVFQMPKPVSITGRTSSITNAFVNGIIPCIYPSEKELRKSLEILKLNPEDLRCAYCGHKSTEWDHLRPIVEKKKPTGYISNIYNLVPACGKCNQSKGNKYWRDWINSTAPLSPKTRGIQDIKDRIGRLEEYEKWAQVKPIDFQNIVGKELWDKHWDNCEKLHEMMKEAQEIAQKIKGLIDKETK